MLCRHPARVCPHAEAEADIAEAAGGVGTHPDGAAWGHTLMEPASGSCDFSRAAWGHTLVNSVQLRRVCPHRIPPEQWRRRKHHIDWLDGGAPTNRSARVRARARGILASR